MRRSRRSGIVHHRAGGHGPGGGRPVFPSKPIRFIVPYPPAGTAGIQTRAISGKLTEAWGQPVVIDHRPGGGPEALVALKQAEIPRYAKVVRETGVRVDQSSLMGTNDSESARRPPVRFQVL